MRYSNHGLPSPLVISNATVMSWRGTSGGIKAAQMGHDVIMTPNLYCYFDYLQTADSKDEPLCIGGYVPVEKVYSLDPTAALTEEQAKHILGAQANLWTEYIATTEHAEYMILPRMAALERSCQSPASHLRIGQGWRCIIVYLAKRG